MTDELQNMPGGLNITNKQLSQGCKLLKALAAETRPGKKLVLIQEAGLAVQTWLAQYLQLALDPYRTFGIKVKPKQVPEPADSNPKDVWSRVEDLVGDLSARRLVGKQAREAVAAMLGSVTGKFQRMLVPLFNRNITVGLQATTINKLWPGLIPQFDCQLAMKSEDVFRREDDATKVGTGRWWVEPKFDGLRCLVICDPREPLTLSRSGKPLNLKKVTTLLAKVAHETAGESVVIDCEAFGADWNSSMAAAPGTKHKDASDICLWAFDCVRLEDFKKGESRVPLTKRRKLLRRILKAYKKRVDSLGTDAEDLEALKVVASFIRLVPRVKVKSLDEAWRHTREWVKQGMEGAILKDARAPYQTKRNPAWTKLVFHERGDYKITGYQEGKGKHEGRLGAFMLDIDGVESKCGGGFTDAQREKFWRKRKKMIGRTVEVAFREKTKKGVGKKSGGKMRFPVFIRMRPDKD